MSAFDELHKNVNGPILKLARRGRLVDESFKLFQRKVYPGASPEQVAAMRISFFAGATELNAMLTFGSDLSSDVTDADLEFWSNVVGEIELFHTRTIAASDAGGDPQ